MDKLFDIVFLEGAFGFLNSLDKKHSQKILYNIRKAQVEQDPALLKSWMTKYGNSERYFRAYNIVY